MAYGNKINIKWNKAAIVESGMTKEQFIDMHKVAYPNMDLAAEYDKIVPKAEKSKGAEPKDGK